MTMPNGSSPTAFSHSWIGGDIHGLQHLAETLHAYIPKIPEATGRLSAVVRNLTDGGTGAWRGTAADGFTAAWRTQAKAATALEDYVAAIAQAIGALAVELSQIENALEQQAADAACHGVRVGDDGMVIAYAGEHAYPYARAYDQFRKQALAEAGTVRDTAARQLDSLFQQVMNPNNHPNTGDAATMADVLAGLLATPTAARREITGRLKKLNGERLKLDREIADAKKAGTSAQGSVKESAQVRGELKEVQEELGKTGRLESSLSKLLDTRVSDVNARLQGAAGPGRHVAGNTPEDLRSAANEEPDWLKSTLGLAEKTPLVDVAATVAGTGIGTYYDVEGGQSLPSAIGDELIANTTGTLATNAGSAIAGAAIGTRLGAAGGPVGVAAGAVAGYTIGDATHNALEEPWSQDIRAHGAAGGVAHGAHHVADQTVDDGRELIIGTGHQIEHYWDDIADG